VDVLVGYIYVGIGKIKFESLVELLIVTLLNNLIIIKISFASNHFKRLMYRAIDNCHFPEYKR